MAGNKEKNRCLLCISISAVYNLLNQQNVNCTDTDGGLKKMQCFGLPGPFVLTCHVLQLTNMVRAIEGKITVNV